MLEWLKHNGSVIIISIITVALSVGASVYVMNRTFARADEEVQLNGKIDSRIDAKLVSQNLPALAGDVREIKGQLTALLPYIQMLTTRELNSAGRMSPQAFKRDLPKIGDSLIAAHASDAHIEQETLNEIRRTLLSLDRNSTSYWHTASAYVNYAGGPIKDQKPCFDPEKDHLTWVPVSSPDASNPPPDQVRFMSCILDLDTQIFREDEPSGVRKYTLVCEHCTIHYSGGPIPILDSPRFVRLNLTNCVFSMQARDDSPLLAKSLIANILGAPDESYVSFGSS